MPLPDSLTSITVTGAFLDGQGAGRAGTVAFRLPVPMSSQGDDIVIPPFELTVQLDEDGAFTVDLPATTDPQWTPNTAEYLVMARFEDWSRLWWSFPLPHDTAGGALDLADVGAPNVGSPSQSSVVQPVADGGYRSTWDSGTLYRIGDTVQHGSAVYGALKPSTAVTPGTDATTWKIYPSSGGGGGAVDSVFGRTGDVEAEAGDYAIADITGLQTALDGKQASDADLTAIAGLAPSNDDIMQRKAGAWTSRSMAQVKADLALTKGDVGLGNVDNTSDAGKPVSTAQAAADAVVAGDAASALAAHAADTTGVHGIADTSALATLTDIAGRQPLDADLTAIAALSPSNDDIVQRKAGAWTNRTMAQLAADVQGSLTIAEAQVTGLTAALAGKAATAHTHAAGDIDSGTFAIARIPTGQTGSTVPLGNDARFTDTRTPTDGTVTTAKIVDSNVTLAKLATIAAARILGNNTGGAAAPIALTAAEVKTLLAIAQADVSGLTAALALLAPLASPALTGTVTAVNLTQSGRYLSTPDALTDQATIAVDASLGNQFTLTLGGNRTLGNPSNSTNGQMILFAIRQDGTGSRTLALGSDYRLGADITAVTLSTAAGKTDYLGVRYNATDSKWDVIAFVKGY